MKALYLVLIVVLVLGAAVLQVDAVSHAMGIFSGAEYLGAGWLWSAWFGYLADLGGGWIWFLADGVDGNIVYAAGEESAGIWFYVPSTGESGGRWYWTSADIYPGWYDFQSKLWINVD